MNRSRCCLIIAIVAALGSRALKADWSEYKPAPLTTVWSEATILEGADYTVEARYGKYLVEASYGGEHREVNPERRKLIRSWAKAVGLPQFAELYEHEVAVQAGNKTFWLPLQKPLVEPFAKEAGAGSRLKLYVVYIGAVKEDRVIVVNEFEVLPASASSSALPPAQVALTLPGRASHIPTAPLNVRVYFVPMGSVAYVDMDYLVRYYERRLGLTVQALPAVALDERTFNAPRQQYEAEGLLALLKRAYPELVDNGGAVLIGITEADIYLSSQNWRFALGWREETRFAVVSSARMDLDHVNLGVPSDPVALHSRLTKMISREIGFLYYAHPFSPNQRSLVRPSIMSVDELDALGEDF